MIFTAIGMTWIVVKVLAQHFAAIAKLTWQPADVTWTESRQSLIAMVSMLILNISILVLCSCFLANWRADNKCGPATEDENDICNPYAENCCCSTEYIFIIITLFPPTAEFSTYIEEHV